VLFRSNHRVPKAKTLIKKKIIDSNLTPEELEDKKEKLKISNLKLQENKKKALEEFNKTGDIDYYRSEIEDIIQEHELYRKNLDTSVKYHYSFKDNANQCDYVCGILKYNVNEKRHELHDWFIISRPLRNFISLLKYPEIFNENYLKSRKKHNVFRPVGKFDSIKETEFKLNQSDNYLSFELDIYDALSGNQNVVCNTYRKFKLLERDYLNKKTYNVLWEKLKQKICKDTNPETEKNILETFLNLFTKEFGDQQYDEFYKIIFTKLSDVQFKTLIEEYFPNMFKKAENTFRTNISNICYETSKKIKTMSLEKRIEIAYLITNNYNNAQECVTKNEFRINFDNISKILNSDVCFKTELKVLNEIENSMNNYLWPNFKQLILQDESKKKKIIKTIFPRLAAVEKILTNLYFMVKNDSNRALKIEGVEQTNIIPKRFIDEIAKKHFENIYIMFHENNFSNEIYKDIYRHLRSEKFTVERCHDIVALICYVIYNENIFFKNDDYFSHEYMILYHDSYVHASWDIHDWLREKLYSEKMEHRIRKYNWCEDVVFY